MVQVLDVPLLSQLIIITLRKAQEDGLSILAPANHMRTRAEVQTPLFGMAQLQP